MDGSKRKRKLGPYKKDLLTDDAIEKCLPSVTTYEGNLKLDTSEECLNIENVDFPSTSKSKEMKLNKEHLVWFFFSCFHLFNVISAFLKIYFFIYQLFVIASDACIFLFKCII